MDRVPGVVSPPPPPPLAAASSRTRDRGGDGHGGRHSHSHSHSTSHHKLKPSSSEPQNSRSSSDKENAHVKTTTTPSRRRPKVRFTDMEPEPTPLLFNARDSMYMRAELQREFDFGIPAQEEAHRYARWCEEEARREAAEAKSTEAAGGGYAKADMVVHPKRLSTDLGAMDIDFSNLGEDVSGLDVFSRVEAALGKKAEEKRKQKAQKEKEKKEKKESTRDKLKASLLASPKRENSYSSLDEPSVGVGELVKEKKGSRFLRKVISDRVIKPKDGGAGVNSNLGPAAADARAKEISDFFGKMATQPVPGQAMWAPLPENTATPTPTAKPPSTMERWKSDNPLTIRKEPPLLPSSNVPEGRRPSQPDLRTHPPPAAHTNGRPPSKSEPPPPPPPLMNGKKLSQASTIRTVPGSSVSPNAPRPSREEHKNNDNILQSKGWEQNGTHLPPHHEEVEREDKRRPSLPARPASSTNSQFHHHAPSHGANGPASTLRIQDSSSRQPSPNRSKSLKAPPPPPSSQPQKSAPQQPPPPSLQAPTQAPTQVTAADDLFSRIEQDIARNHPLPLVKEKGGDERTRDKGRKLFGKALEHIKHGGEKMKEKMEKERK
ncbi:hypothetical protein L211DRAFT_486328 [Terfezia boudieri ATCC MYA-4762]|uniref:Uncharacterized protein n=1 Tax=Terfezia boudieri ATCC MYA-4762 TaxID=1051890 RepID=A0A3N4LYY0_9PEZI|nr:hypothetical protein L211DRAFT_486328 [Terfezia boudieri ATCC MYA-4762]